MVIITRHLAFRGKYRNTEPERFFYFKMIIIKQNNNPNIEIDNRDKKVVVLWQTNDNAEAIVIERIIISNLIDLLKKEIK